MKRLVFTSLLFVTFIGFTSAAAHKFYVAIFQINYAKDTKMLQITSRVFADDLNVALQNKYKRPFHLSDAAQTPDDVAKMQLYFAENFAISVNGKAKALQFISLETENNVLVCYFRVTDITSVRSVAVSNKILFDYVTEQQNIVQTNINGSKHNLLLTADNPSGTIKF